MQSRSLEISERLQIIIETAQKIKELPQDDVVGQQLNKIFYDNYELLDAKMTSEELLIDNSSDILLENFFVNFIFKKPFYIYGLQRTRELLLTIWNRIEKVCESTKDSAMDLESTVAIIMEIEFEYSHNRKALF